jgi:hypothetical protein
MIINHEKGAPMILERGIKSLLLVPALALSASAFAEARSTTGTETSLNDLREKCQTLLANPQMVKPTISISCDQHRYEWRQCAGKFSSEDTRSVSAHVGMKDYTVNQAQTWTTPAQHDCVVLTRHHLYTRPVEESITCEDLLARFTTQDDLISHCDQLIQERVALDSSLVTDMGSTGEVMNTCSSVQGVVQQGDRVRGEGEDECPPMPNQNVDQNQGGDGWH